MPDVIESTAHNGVAAVITPAHPIPLRGTPPCSTPADLLTAIRYSQGHTLAEITATWIVSGRRRSPRTRTAYAQDVSWWLGWCKARGVNPMKAKPLDADQYAAAMSVVGLADATIARRLAAASSWYSYAVRHDAATRNPFTDMERPSVDAERGGRALSREETAAVLAHCAAHETLRTTALMWTLYATAARVSSVLDADVTDLGYDQGHRVLTLTGKGAKTRKRAIPPQAGAAIDAYVGDRRDGPLFATRTGGRLDRVAVFRLVRRVAKAAGVHDAESLSPHSLRRTHATHALGDGVALHRVQDQLDHADPRTTQGYNKARQRLDDSPAYGLAEKMSAAIDRD
jgi:integrase/recombinase XerD